MIGLTAPRLRPALISLALAIVPAHAACAAGPTREAAAVGEDAASRLAVGDKLRVTFFEQMDLPAAGAGAAPTSTFYQRVDLTSDYIVSADGSISLPRLGRFMVIGRTDEEVRDEIRSSYENAMGRDGDVHVAVLERQPIYVIGPVRSPGAFPYVGGMLAIQAIALAGGAERVQDRLTPVVEAGRESERSDDTRTRLTSLLARRAWLEAVQAGTAPAIPDELIRLVGREGAREMIAATERAGLTAAGARRNEAAKLEKSIAAAGAEIAALRRSLDEIASAIAKREATIAAVTEPDARLSKMPVINVQLNEIGDLEARRSQILSMIQRIEQQTAQTEAARDRISFDFTTASAQELVTLTNDIVRLRLAAGSALQIAGSLAEGAAPAETSDLDITIVRTTVEGPTTISATETTRLLPGDVVRIGRPVASMRASGAVTGLFR